MATPQWPMPHFGSVFATSENPFSASSYQNECSSATARLNFCCAGLVHDVAKLTLPSFSLSGCLCGCVSCAKPETLPISTARVAGTTNLMSLIKLLPHFSTKGGSWIDYKMRLTGLRRLSHH